MRLLEASFVAMLGSTLNPFSDNAFAGENCLASRDAFVQGFTKDIDFQHSAIPEELEYGRLRETEKDFDFYLDVRKAPREQLKFFETGWFPTEAERERRGLEFDVKSTDSSDLVIELYKPETDYIIRYWFDYKNDCYMLKRINNESL